MAVGSPQKWARSAPSPLWGEGWGEGNMRPPCGLRIPTTNWHGRLPLLFWERVGVRGNMRPPCGLREPYNKLARSAPSPLWGEGWGEGEHAASLWAEGSLQKYWHGRLPLLFGERAGVRGYMRLRWWFRSPYVLHFSASRVTRERATRPGLRSTLRRFSAGFTLPHASQSPECGTGVDSPLSRSRVV